MRWREKEILEVLEKGGKLKTGAILEKVDMARPTCLKYLESLRGMGLIDNEQIGPTKVWFTVKGEKLESEEALSMDKRLKRIIGDLELITGVKPKMLVDANKLVIFSSQPSDIDFSIVMKNEEEK